MPTTVEHTLGASLTLACVPMPVPARHESGTCPHPQSCSPTLAPMPSLTLVPVPALTLMLTTLPWHPCPCSHCRLMPMAAVFLPFNLCQQVENLFLILSDPCELLQAMSGA